MTSSLKSPSSLPRVLIAILVILVVGVLFLGGMALLGVELF
ncbi:MAG TPA: hypothetical protein VH933_11960 [Aestuariivirgaceae bacterium]|jgi:hypothetical protein